MKEEITGKMDLAKGLQDFLKKNKTIYTIRKYSMREAPVKVEKLGLYIRIPLGRVREIELPKYVKLSGFTTVDSWLDRLKKINGEDIINSMYLYKLEEVAYKKLLNGILDSPEAKKLTRKQKKEIGVKEAQELLRKGVTFGKDKSMKEDKLD